MFLIFETTIWSFLFPGKPWPGWVMRKVLPAIHPPSESKDSLCSLSYFLGHCHTVINKLLLCLLVSEGHSWKNLMLWASWDCFATTQEEMENIVSRTRKDQQHPQKFNWEVEFLSRIDRKPINTTKIMDKCGKAGNRYNLSLQRRELSLNFREVLSLRIKMDWIQDTYPIHILGFGRHESLLCHIKMVYTSPIYCFRKGVSLHC